MIVMKTTRSARRTGRDLIVPLFLLAALAVFALTAGCGGGSSEDDVVAMIGDRTVSVGDYEAMLSKLDISELPFDESGLPIDTATLEGKKAFLGIIVHKELMALKAQDLGFDADENISSARGALIEYNAGTLMHTELVEKPSKNITEAEIDEYFAKLKTIRNCRFMICNFRDDAEEARAKIMAGELWETVADEYNDGSRGPKGDYTLPLQWGRMEDTFEEAVFSLDLGEVTRPIETVYGWWIVRYESSEETRVQDLDETFRDRIRSTLEARKVNLMQKQFIQASRQKHSFRMNEGALWTIYQGMPEVEDFLDPVTNKPVPKGMLKPLEISGIDLDREFFSVRFDLEADPDTWTIGDFKALYDEMSVFQRPKRTELLGGVRKKILQDLVDRTLLVSEARERGYFERSEVIGETRQRTEQAMVSKLHDEVVKIDDSITPEQIDEFWAVHSHEYTQNLARRGRVVYTVEREKADAAKADAESKTWDQILEDYGANPENKSAKGMVRIAVNGTGDLRDALFALAEPGDLSDPFPVQGGWGVCKLESIEPGRNLELDEVRQNVGQRMKSIRKEEALTKLLLQWRQEYGVTVYDDQLENVKSWPELTSDES